MRLLELSGGPYQLVKLKCEFYDLSLTNRLWNNKGLLDKPVLSNVDKTRLPFQVPFETALDGEWDRPS